MNRNGTEAENLPIVKSVKWRYNGQTVALIDERAASSPEMSAMLLKSANGTVLIGSKTSGANGVVHRFWLPGGIACTYSQTIIQWPDGRDVQGKVLAPDIEVAPTINGLRAGPDEVLERALQYLGVNDKVHGVWRGKVKNRIRHQ